LTDRHSIKNLTIVTKWTNSNLQFLHSL
jgi:hypothetical protein